MGLFDTKKTSTSTVSNNSTTEVGAQGTDNALTIAGSDNVSIVQSDSGAISVAGEIATDALNIGGDAIDAIVKSTADVFDAIIESHEDSLSFAAANTDRSFDFAAANTDRSFDFAESQTDQFTDFARGLVGASLSQVSDTVERSQDSLSSTVTALNTIAKEQSTSTDQRVQAVAKYAIIGVVLAGVGLAFAFRGK